MLAIKNIFSKIFEFWFTIVFTGDGQLSRDNVGIPILKSRGTTNFAGLSRDKRDRDEKPRDCPVPSLAYPWFLL